jgi:hypothetical protein
VVKDAIQPHVSVLLVLQPMVKVDVLLQSAAMDALLIQTRRATEAWVVWARVDAHLVLFPQHRLARTVKLVRRSRAIIYTFFNNIFITPLLTAPTSTWTSASAQVFASNS